MNGSDPNREIGFGSVVRAGEAKLRDIHALLDPIDAPNGRPPPVPGAPPDDCPGLSRLCAVSGACRAIAGIKL